MAFCFERDVATQVDLRRIASAQLASALARIDDHALASDLVVHEVRKTLMKLRALVRLVRPGFADYRAENNAFRDAAAMLSPLRDATVLIETYDALMDSCSGEADRSAFAPVRRRLTARQKMLDREASGADRKLGDVRDLLVAAHVRVSQWKLNAHDFEALETGLERTYRAARKAMKESARSRHAEATHEWRKHVKYHGYHARLLEPIWPAALQAHREAAEQLSDWLGQHHDLALLDDLLQRAPDEFGKAAETKVLRLLIDSRQTDLVERSFALGSKLFAEPAEPFTRRWRRYWTQWRGEPVDVAA